MSTSNATVASPTATVGSHGQRTHQCQKCKGATVHAYAHPKGVRLALHLAKIAGSVCTLGLAFPHEFAMAEAAGRCTQCGTAASVPYA